MGAGIDRDAWLAAIGDPVVVDPEAITTQEFASLLGISFRNAQRRMQELIAAGKAGVGPPRPTKDVAGRRTKIPTYKLIKP